jgi:hypothetical protein
MPSCVASRSTPLPPLHCIPLPSLSYQEGSVRWRRAKLVVVGGGGEGKSAMVRALSGQPFVVTESTVGAATSMHELERRQVTRPPSSDCYHHRP